MTESKCEACEKYNPEQYSVNCGMCREKGYPLFKAARIETQVLTKSTNIVTSGSLESYTDELRNVAYALHILVAKARQYHTDAQVYVTPDHIYILKGPSHTSNGRMSCKENILDSILISNISCGDW